MQYLFASLSYVLLLAYFTFLKKIKVGLRDHAAVCVCLSPLSLLGNGSVKVPLSLLGNGSVKSPVTVRQRLGKNPLIVARQGLGKNPPIVTRQRLGRNVTAVTNAHATLEELSDALFSMWPMSYQGK
jgi:hypothetical protein